MSIGKPVVVVVVVVGSVGESPTPIEVCDPPTIRAKLDAATSGNTPTVPRAPNISSRAAPAGALRKAFNQKGSSLEAQSQLQSAGTGSSCGKYVRSHEEMLIDAECEGFFWETTGGCDFKRPIDFVSGEYHMSMLWSCKPAPKNVKWLYSCSPMMSTPLKNVVSQNAPLSLRSEPSLSPRGMARHEAGVPRDGASTRMATTSGPIAIVMSPTLDSCMVSRIQRNPR
mmetsp:Transcript_111318/g.314240  ORF Transcript_111318/g.314240 Transcript_111318/m.314240 type:complete len:226 (+) Transcript_111318:918-1595(+)